MGGLHTQMNYMATIGDYLQDSELPLMWVEAGCVSEGEADKILQGRDYEGGIRIHKITWQAIWKMVQFLEYLKENHADLHTDITTLAKELASPPLVTLLDTTQFSNILDSFLEEKKVDKNFKFIWNYIWCKSYCLSPEVSGLRTLYERIHTHVG